jgi:hypothetical protein
MRFANALLAAMLIAGTAHAQADEATVSAARMLAEEGSRAWEARDWAGALVKYNQAEALAPSPLFSLRAAQCLERLGRLVEAAERYQRTPADEAAALRASILPKIAHLRLTVTGQPELLIVDGKKQPIEIARDPIALDPGAHRIVVRAGSNEARGEITLGEGEEKTLEFALPTAAIAPSVQKTELPKSVPASPMRAIGFVTLAVGSAGFGAGLVMLGAAVSQASSLDAACPNRICSSSDSGRVASYETLRTASFVTLVAGAGIAGAGLTLVLIAPKRTQVVIGPSTLVLRGTF